jgi:general secretion pathway protein I
MKKPVSRRRQSGYTLIETIVATLVLAIGIYGALGAMSSSSRLAASAEEYATAARLADQKFAELGANPDSLSGSSQEGDFGTDFPGFAWRMEVNQAEFTDLKQVVLTVDWPSGASRRAAEFVTYRVDTSSQSTAGSQS